MSERDQTRRGSGAWTPIGAGIDRAEQPPEVKRPRGTAWRRLEAEGVTWEGQVLLVGEEADLVARLIVTRRRVAFVRGGAIVLEVGREWLKPPPLMLPDGTIALSVTLDGTDPEDLFVQVREGRRVAGHLVTLLGGSGVRRALPAPPLTPPKSTSAPRPATPSAAPIPGPLFPDEIGGALGRPSTTTAPGGLPVRLDLSPPRPYEPSWTRPRRERAATTRPAPPSEARRDPTGDRAEPVERVAALAPPVSPLHPLGPTDDAWATLDVLAPSPPARPPRAGDDQAAVVPAAAPPGIGTNHDWNLQPIRGMAPRAARRRRRQEWLARLLGLMVLVVLASVAIASRTPVGLPGSDEPRLSAPMDASPPSDLARAAPTATANPPAPGTTVVDLAAQTAEAIGVGGPSSSATVAVTTAPTSEAPIPPGSTAGGDQGASDAGEGGWLTAADTPGGAAPAPSATATEPPAPIATEPPAPTATAIATAALSTASPTATGAPTPAPTATEAPTEAPTASPTTSPTEPAAAAADEAAVPTQAPSLAVGEVPAQGFADGPFRFAIVGAVRAPSVPALNLYDYGTGEWVALIVDVVNWSDDPATLGMPDFTLEDASRTAPVLLDTGTGLIARSLGLEAAYVHDAQVPYAAGEQHRILLLFLVHPDATGLTLRAGEAAVGLRDVLAETFDPADLPPEEPIAPDLLQGTVMAVLDAVTIEVEIEGVRQEVRYLGIEAPDGDACWGAEAIEANTSLVAGQTVWLERQRSNADRQGRLLRDAWVAGPDGSLDLVAARLVALGAAEPKTTVPNTRFSGWLTAVAADAEVAGAGRWAACPATAGGIGLGQGLAIVLPFLLGLVWLALGTPGLESVTLRRHGATPGDARHANDRSG